MLVLLALLPFAAMCVNAIVCALGIVDSVGSFTLWLFYPLPQCASMRLRVHLVSLILWALLPCIAMNINATDCKC